MAEIGKPEKTIEILPTEIPVPELVPAGPSRRDDDDDDDDDGGEA